MILAPPPNAPPERILAYGSEGTGKSTAYLSIAAAQPTSQFHVLNSDEALARMLYARDLPNVHVRQVETWQDYVENTKEVIASLTPADWLVIDLLDPAWAAAHAYYVEVKFKKEVPDFYMDFAVANKKGNPLQGDTDWAQINRVWFAYANMLKRCPANIFACAAEKATGERDNAETITEYGHLGAKPAGQKQVGHLFHTTLRFHRKKRTGERLLTTAKDRERRELRDVKFEDFAKAYLLPVAGWRPAKA